MSYGAPPPPFDPNAGQQPQPPYGQNPYGQPQQPDPYNPYGQQQPGGYQQPPQLPPMGQQPYPQAPPPSPTRGRGGRVLGVLGTIGLVLVVAVLKLVVFKGADNAIDSVTEADRNKTGEVTDSGDLDPIELKNGDCFQNGVSSTVTETVHNIDAIPCNKAHDAQVIALFSVPGAYPAAAESKFSELCKAKVQVWAKANPVDYKTLIKLDPKWSYVYLYPKATSWARGDHKVSCSIATKSKVLTRKVAVVR